MIKVFDSLIDEQLVVGIGPLMLKRSTDPIALSYKERTYYFELYLVHYRVTIITDPLPFSLEREKCQAEYERIKEAHKAVSQALVNGAFCSLVVNKLPENPPYNE